MSITPNDDDVLLGRGYNIIVHPGNKLLRSMVQAQKQSFLQSKKKSKKQIAIGIVDDIDKLGGRFLIEDPRSINNSATLSITEKTWICVDKDKAVSKVMHRLREKETEPSNVPRSRVYQDGIVTVVDDCDPQISGALVSSFAQNSAQQAIDMLPFGIGQGGSATVSTTPTEYFAMNLSQVNQSIENSAPVQQDTKQPFTSEKFQPAPIHIYESNLIVENSLGSPPPQTQANLQPLAPKLSNENHHLNLTYNAQHSNHHVGQSMQPSFVCKQSLLSPGHPIRLNEPAGRSIGITSDSWSDKNITISNGQKIDGSDSGPNDTILDLWSDTGITISDGRKLEGGGSVQVLSGGSKSRAGKRSFCFLDTKDSMEGLQFPMSVVEFLNSGCLSSLILSLHREDKVVNMKARDDLHQVQGQTLENAARLALLLTHLFIDCIPEMDFASVKLDDFSIVLEQGMTGYHIAQSKASSAATFLQIEFFPSTRVNGLQKQSQSEAMRLLGKLLYSVFSEGRPTPSDLSMMTTAPPPIQESLADVNERSPKISRMAEISIFSELSERDSFPVSICRLVSDMVDTRLGVASNPFRSFDAIIQDLEQMVYDPDTFLHDPCFPQGVPFRPIFGEKYRGREKEIANFRKVANSIEQSLQQESPGSPNSDHINAIFVSGIAGSGKSHLVQTVEDKLGPGWIVVKAKFERCRKHASKRILSSMFDQLIVNLVKMKKSGRSSDVAYSQQVSASILNTIGYDRLPSLVNFLPSLSSLFDDICDDKTGQVQADATEFQLIFSVSNILGAMLESGRLIMICCDDLQWADKTSLLMISEVLVSTGSGSFKRVCSGCLFVGLFRHDEIGDHHPFTIQYSYLEMMTNNIKITKIKLSSLSKEDISDMLMAELRLPLRFVEQLADVVHKKTSGHALFAIELLNSHLRSSIIAYSFQKRRYSWDQDTIDIIKTEDGVAGLIASNLKSLSPSSQRVLQILSCFGIQTNISLLQLLENFQKGIICSLDTLVDKGILDRAYSIVIFAHDLIQQEVYESMPLAERQMLHLDIGQFLGEQADIDKTSAAMIPMKIGFDRLQLDDRDSIAGKNMAHSSLISLACDQIDSAGLDIIRDEGLRVQFAVWNLYGGKEAYRWSNSRAALHYFSKGIKFLGQDCWHKNHVGLCLELHEGAAMALFTLGEPENVIHYADKITSNTTFEDSLEIHPILLRSLSQLSRHKESISRAIYSLRQLNFDIPLAAAPASVLHAIATTDSMASKFSMDQMLDLCEKAVDGPGRRVIEIIGAFFSSCYQSSSPFMPLVACATIQFSLQHGICHESTSAFAIFGMLKISNEGDYHGGKYWADVVREIAKKHKTSNSLPELLLQLTVDIWFMPPRDISENLLRSHKKAIRNGEVDAAMFFLQTGWRFRLLGGEQLSLVYKSSEERLRLLAKHSQHAAKCGLLDSILLMELTGKSGNYFSAFEGSIGSMNDLQDTATSINDLHLLQSIHVFNVLIAYWKGDYIAAEESSRIASKMLPASKMPTIYLIYHTFFRGLILFQLHRMFGGEQRLKDAKEMMDKMEIWLSVSMAAFESKWLLLKAEYWFCVDKFGRALQMYKGSIKSAQDNGNIHELALAHELLGKFYSKRDHLVDNVSSECGIASNECFKKAHAYYTQWGATAVAEKILKDHNLEMDLHAPHLQTRKHPRQTD
mmetsp:Transcript_30851/g.66674  ORF Transcript_30851/g.66674 Transcript_30851/m.66674 type:complete len:1679 (-) Transcript_30851:132-5168(-)